MDRSEALQIVKKQLPEKRYIHTLGVMETALQLAKKYNVDPKKAELAAIFHDYAKYRPKQEMKQIIIEQNLPRQLLQFHHELWHAPVGAYLAKEEAGITDAEVLQAIANHTTGSPQMTALDKVIFLADYIEPGRKFPGVDEVRKLAETNMEEAVIQALRNTIIFLLEKKQTVYPDTLFTYNTLLIQYKST